eukprot:Gb_35346 [translate_table: standard]
MNYEKCLRHEQKIIHVVCPCGSELYHLKDQLLHSEIQHPMSGCVYNIRRCEVVLVFERQAFDRMQVLGAWFCRYDYSGYGQSTGKVRDLECGCFTWFLMLLLPLKQPSECNTYADIEAAYRCLEEQYGVREEDIVLYGQSVGSGPTLDLAARRSRLRAVVLHSPILSGLRVMYPVKRTYWFDIYKNIDKIGLVNCPVLIMHVSVYPLLLFCLDFLVS